MSKLEVDKIDPQSGTDLELGTSGDTITIPAGVTFDSSAATNTLPSTVVTTTGTQTLTNKSIATTQLTGTITPSDSTVTLAKLTATGTQDATTFLRGDNTFATPAGGTNTPAFEAYLGGSGGQALSDNTITLVTIDTEVYDTDSAYNTSTYKFTPQTAGKYMVYASVMAETGSAGNLNENYIYIRKNGNNVAEYEKNFTNNPNRIDVIQVSTVLDMNGSTDYVQLYGRVNSVSGSGQILESYTQYKRATAFGAYKIIE